MDPKNRLFIVIAVTLLIVGAMFTSFGRSLFTMNTPEVVLPSSSAGPGDPSGSSSGGGELYQPVQVAPDTVREVVATLARPASYYRELTVETFWSGGSSSTQVQVWSDGDWSHSRQVLPSGVIRHDLVGEDVLYYWYEGSQQYERAPADERSSDLAQHIPTYETVLALDADEILDAGYEVRGELPCIYVEVSRQGSAARERYWVSVDNGLLVSAEMWEEEQLVYRMSAYSPVQSPCPTDAEFALPDGEVLHTVGQ